MPSEFTRRDFIRAAAVLGGAAWVKAHRVPFAFADTTTAAPPGFPSNVELFRQAFENWAKEIRVDDLWTCAPRNETELLAVANWAYANQYRLRPRGASHGWAPLVVTGDSDSSSRVVLIDTSHFDGVSISGTSVTVGSGVMMEQLLAEMETAGLGFVSVPAVGQITVGGALAIGGHGSGVPAVGESPVGGQSFGCLSHLVENLRVVVWDADANQFVVETIDRSDSRAPSLLVHLGRTFVTRATLQASPNYRLRCVSSTHISADELFARPGSRGRLLSKFIDKAGRVETIHFPFTDFPWLKVWSVSPNKPLKSREVTEPYNYPFSDTIPPEMDHLARDIIRGNTSSTPLFGKTSFAVSAAALKATASEDLWGWSRNLQHYIRASTLRATANGYGLLVKRSDVQRTLHEFHLAFQRLLKRYASDDRYPVNMPVEIRVSGIDRPSEVGGASGPAISATAPDPAHPERDTVVWFNVLTFAGTPHSAEFYSELEAFIMSHFRRYATVRVEWSKGWAYTPEGPWTNQRILKRRIPASHSSTWDVAVSDLDAMDPGRVFSNTFIDNLVS